MRKALFALSLCCVQLAAINHLRAQEVAPASNPADGLVAPKNTLVLRGHDNWVTGVRFNPDGKQVASSSRDGTVRLWDAATGQEVRTLKKHKGESSGGHETYVQDVAFSPDGVYLASAGSDQNIYLWNAKSGNCLACLMRNRGAVQSITYSPDGKRLASIDAESAKIWDANPEMHTGWYVLSLPHRDGLCVAFSPNGNLVASGGRDKSIRVWDPTTGAELLTMKCADQVLDVSFSPDGKQLASTTADGLLSVWDTSSGKLSRTIESQQGSGAARFSRDWKFLVATTGDNSIKLWDVSTGDELVTLNGHRNGIHSLDFSSSGNQLVSGSMDRTARIWRLPAAAVDP